MSYLIPPTILLPLSFMNKPVRSTEKLKEPSSPMPTGQSAFLFLEICVNFCWSVVLVLVVVLTLSVLIGIISSNRNGHRGELDRRNAICTPEVQDILTFMSGTGQDIAHVQVVGIVFCFSGGQCVFQTTAVPARRLIRSSTAITEPTRLQIAHNLSSPPSVCACLPCTNKTQRKAQRTSHPRASPGTKT